MTRCCDCGDPIDRDGGALLMYCGFCRRLHTPAGWGDPEASA